MDLEKLDIGVVGRCDGVGSLNQAGDYVKMHLEGYGHFGISVGAAENLIAELQGVLAAKEGE